MRLGYWQFNNNNWVGEEGQVPSVTNNIGYVTNWNNGALQVNSSTSRLGYNAFRPDGMPNVRRNTGTIRFWYCPDWTSGFGPNNRKLFEMDSGWCLSVTGNGTLLTLTVSGQSYSQSIDWTANQWHQIAVTYTRDDIEIFRDLHPGFVQLFVDGTNLCGSTYCGQEMTWDPQTVSRFSIGSGVDGLDQASGLYDELETFNYFMNPDDIRANYQNVSALDSDEDGSPNLQEIANGTDPYNPDTDGDGVLDGADAFPLDPNRWDPPDNGTTPPVIQLLEPITAHLAVPPNAPTLTCLQMVDPPNYWIGEIEINATDNPDYIKVYMNADTTPISQGNIYMPECGGQLVAAKWQGNPVDLYSDEVNFTMWMSASEVKNCVEGPMCAPVQCQRSNP